MKHTKQKSIGAIFSLVLALFVFGAVGINGAFAIAVINQSLLPTLNNGVFNVTATQSDIDTCVAAGGDRFSYEITQDGATFLLLQSFAFPLSALNFSYPLTSSATAYAFVCSNANNDILVPLVIIQIESVNRTFVYQPLSFSTALPIITESSWPTLNSGTFDVTAEQSDVNTCVAAGGDRFSYSSSLDGVIYQTLQSFVFPLSALNFSYPLTRSAVIYGFMCSNSSNDELIVLANVTTLFLVLSNPIYQPLLFHPYIAPTTGTPEVGSVLTAGALTPAEATVSYNWRISDTEDGTYADTSPASTTTTYIPSASEIGKYLKVVVTGTGSYSGISTSTATTVITGKQLTISDPSLTLSKIYDGNASASVTAGTLSGVIDGDEVTVTAAANYDSASGGVNKTITVAYTLGGAQASGYIKPVNYTVSNGVIDSGGSVPVSFLTPPANIPAVPPSPANIPTVPPSPANPTQTDLQNLINFLLQKIEALRAQLPPEPNIPIAVGHIFTVNLAFGDSGAEVRELQIFLKAQGLEIYPSGLITGYFGSLTKKATQAFQIAHGIAKEGDYGYGFAGPKTRAKMNQLQGG